MNDVLFNNVSALRREAARKNIYMFAKTYLPHQIMVAPSKGHLKLFGWAEKMVVQRGQRLAVAAPRGYGKTTMFTGVVLAYCVCYHTEDFIIILSHTASQACQILDNLMTELTANEKLRQDFPEIFENEGRPKPPRWTSSSIVTRNSIQVLSLGYGQQIRGRKHGVNRPTMVIMDDLEAGDNTFSKETKDKMKAWLNKSVLKVGTNKTNYIFLGNIFNSFSLLGEIIKAGKVESGWDNEHFKAIEVWPKNMHLWQKCWNIFCGIEQFNGTKGDKAAFNYYNSNKQAMDEQAVLLWPEQRGLFELMMEYYNDETSFMSEMQNEPKDLSEFALDVDSFHYWTDQYLSLQAVLDSFDKDVRYFAAVDLALGKSMVKGDYSSIVIVARKANAYYILEADIARRNPDRLAEDILAYCQRYQFKKFGIEANAFQEFFVQQLRDKAVSRGIRTEFTAIQNTKDKLARIHSLYSIIKNGYLLFAKYHKMLLDECRQFPNCKHDDGLDGLEMAVRLASEQDSAMNHKQFLKILKDLADQKEAESYRPAVSVDEQLKRAMRGDWRGSGWVFWGL